MGRFDLDLMFYKSNHGLVHASFKDDNFDFRVFF